jgi:CRP-like cAMP-binding protein
MGKKGPGQVFGEAYACSPGTPLRVDVVADGPCEVLMLEIARVVATCSSACSHHQLLLVNLMGILAKQSLELSKRSTITAPKTIRGRMLAFLSAEALEQGSRSFSIKMNRNQLASYLGVDRSALSAELGKMQRDGLIEVDRNHFSLSDEVS